MSDTQGGASSRSKETKGVVWNWHPELPLRPAPVFCWPPRPIATLKYLFSFAFLGSVILPFGVLSAIAWFYLQPALERCVELRADWIVQMYGRNLLLLVVVVSACHLYFYKFKRQGSERKFDARDLETSNRRFFTGDQVRDNMFWTIASGVTLWTAYEVLFMWAYANGYAPFFLDWREHPIVFVAWFAIIPFWTSLHFYFVHRLLHWKPLYRLAHSVHHRNDNLGPWAGFSMHPIEHVIYLSSVLIHFLVLSHPLHVFFHCQWNAIGANTSHTGFEALTFRGKPILYLTSFHHQLHHRFYDCNYGNPFMPWDVWFGTNHDGTPESWAEVKRRRREKVYTASRA